MISGVIAEFNPFHNGHAYLLSQARINSEAVICVMSGNFVQRGDIAIYPKHIRAQAALKNGADMVIALPAGWSMSGAENFALGGVSLLKSTSVVDRIVFGCETEEQQLLYKTVEILKDKNTDLSLKKHLSSGITYAAARMLAVKERCEKCADILSLPNNILATEYISAAHKLKFNAEMLPVKRFGAEHDSEIASKNFASASHIRNLIRKGCDYSSFVPENSIELMTKNEFSDISRIDNSLLFKLRSLSLDDIKNLPDISEGIENRIFDAIKTAHSIEDLCQKIKTKRYTYSRIKRIILSACFGIDNSFHKKEPPYIHVLGVTAKGKELLSKIASRSQIPLILSNKDISGLSGFAGKVFNTESLADDLYGLAFTSYKKSGSNYSLPLIKSE